MQMVICLNYDQAGQKRFSSDDLMSSTKISVKKRFFYLVHTLVEAYIPLRDFSTPARNLWV